jgi:hypothetical protein
MTRLCDHRVALRKLLKVLRVVGLGYHVAGDHCAARLTRAMTADPCLV